MGISMSQRILTVIIWPLFIFLEDVQQVIIHPGYISSHKFSLTFFRCATGKAMCSKRDISEFHLNLHNNVKFDSIPILLENWRSPCFLLKYKIYYNNNCLMGKYNETNINQMQKPKFVYLDLIIEFSIPMPFCPSSYFIIVLFRTFLFLEVKNSHSHLDNGHTLRRAHLFVQQQVIASKGKLNPL